MKKKEININGIDKRLAVLLIILTLMGLLTIADASAPLAIREFSDKFYYVKQQLFWAVVGITSMLVMSKINYKYWGGIAKYLFFISLFLLFIVIIPGIGMKVYGAKRWLLIGPWSIQPSEFIKLTLIIYFAKLADREKTLTSFLVPLITIIVLMMLEPDLGTTIIISVIAISQIFVSGVNLINFLWIGLSGGFFGTLLVLFSSYRRDRLITFLQQTTDPLGKSYHVRQILFALGSGGLFGVGLGESRQKYLYLPETATDSIFAVLAEEIGFIGSLIVILLFVYLFYKILKITLRAPDIFSKVFCSGMLAWVGSQVILNIGSMVVLVPLTGIPLPFFSKGGTALAALLTGLGIVLNISKYAKD
jgi:cell division protein FtsW